MSFVLHPRLAADCAVIGDLPVCRVLLMNDRRFPWLILVPRRENLREIFDLSGEDYRLAMLEINETARGFCALTRAHKMNVAALGNAVPQLHIHIIARHTADAAWPQPVWGVPGTAPYAPEALAEMSEKVRESLILT